MCWRLNQILVQQEQEDGQMVNFRFNLIITKHKSASFLIETLSLGCFYKCPSPSLFFVFSIQLKVNFQHQILPMTRFEPRTSGVASYRSTNWATPTALSFFPRRHFLWMLQIKISIFADDWIRTMDLWCCKLPLYQLSHNHCPKCLYFSLVALSLNAANQINENVPDEKVKNYWWIARRRREEDWLGWHPNEWASDWTSAEACFEISSHSIFSSESSTT